MANPKKVLLMLVFIALITLTMLPLNIVEAQDQPLFKVTIIAPGNFNMARRQWGQMFADSLEQLGIDAEVVFLGWVEAFDRVFTPDYDTVGKTWDEGGYDIQLVGWTPGLLPEPRQTYYGSPDFFAPNGENYYLWDNAQSNLLLDTFITSTNTAEQEEALQRWQSLFHNELPNSQIFYLTSPAVITPELTGPAMGPSPNGPGWLYFNVQPNPEMLKGKTEVVYASTGEIESLIPPLSNSWYDTIINGIVFSGLAQVEPSLSDLSIPALLTSWTPSDGGFKWTFECRNGVQWHDGDAFSADDVVFSLWALMNPATGSQFVGYYKSVYGDNVKFTFENGTSATLGTGTNIGNITAVDADTVEVWLPDLALGKPYGYFDPYLLTFANNIIPKHIFEKIPSALWTDSVFNTGVGSIVVPGTPGTIAPETYNGPVGTGPYKWVDYDAVTQLVHLEKWDQYWNRTALEADGLFEVQDYYIRFIADKTPALAALENDEVDMLDVNYMSSVHYQLQDIPTIDPSWGTVMLQEGVGRQEIGYNNRHPIFGTGEDTPLGRSNPARAAEAARNVRIAFDYAVPRQLIIDDLLDGFGELGATPVLPTQPYYNASVSARPYDLARAREYLEKAGYIGLPPVASFTYDPSAPHVGGAVTFNASASYDPDGTIVSYYWDFGDGANGSGITVTHAYVDDDDYFVTLEVTDNNGLTATVTDTVTVLPVMPPVASFTHDPSTPQVGDAVTFDASSSYDPDGTIVSHDWNFGDGNTGTGEIATHAYSTEGSFTITLTVTDNHGLTDTAKGDIIVTRRMLSLKLSGEHDYLFMENVKIRVAALVTDAKTAEPISGADVVLEIYDPNGKLWSSTTMVERLPGTGIYEWESPKTVRQLMSYRHLRKGVYLVHVQASHNGGPITRDILEFHIDPPQEQPIELKTVLLITMIGIAGIIASVWYIDHRRLSRRLHKLQQTKR